MDWSTILLLVLLAAAIWAVAELALVFRKTRGTISTLDENLGTTMGKLNDLLGHVDETVQTVDATVKNLDPALGQVEPLLQKVEVTVDTLSGDLQQVDAILGDVSRMTGSAANASHAVTGVVDTAANTARDAMNKVLKKVAPAKVDAIPEPAPVKALEKDNDVVVEQVEQDAGYFTYPEQTQTEEAPEAKTQDDEE
jgi:ABC-type transporter Mla subunit MlaD